MVGALESDKVGVQYHARETAPACSNRGSDGGSVERTVDVGRSGVACITDGTPHCSSQGGTSVAKGARANLIADLRRRQQQKHATCSVGGGTFSCSAFHPFICCHGFAVHVCLCPKQWSVFRWCCGDRWRRGGTGFKNQPVEGTRGCATIAVKGCTEYSWFSGQCGLSYANVVQ